MYGSRLIHLMSISFRTPHESSSTPWNYQNTLAHFLGSERCSPPRERERVNFMTVWNGSTCHNWILKIQIRSLGSELSLTSLLPREQTLCIYKQNLNIFPLIPIVTKNERKLTKSPQTLDSRKLHQSCWFLLA
jgi:hypothetical protein